MTDKCFLCGGMKKKDKEGKASKRKTVSIDRMIRTVPEWYSGELFTEGTYLVLKIPLGTEDDAKRYWKAI